MSLKTLNISAIAGLGVLGVAITVAVALWLLALKTEKEAKLAKLTTKQEQKDRQAKYDAYPATPQKASAAVQSILPQKKTKESIVKEQIVYLSDIEPAFVNVGWGKFERDVFRDKYMIRLNFKDYDRGLNTHAPAHATYYLSKKYSRFESYIGLWDSGNQHRGIPGDFDKKGEGSVIFQVWLDGEKKYDSDILKSTNTEHINISVEGVVKMELVVDPTSDGNRYDWSVWGDAKLIYKETQTSMLNQQETSIHEHITSNQTESNLPSHPYQELPCPQRYVDDKANIVSDNIENSLNVYLLELEQKTGTQMIVLAINTTGSIPIEMYAIELATKWKLGQKGKDNGVLVVIAKDDRAYRIEVGYGLEGILPDGFCGTVGRTYFVPNFQKGQFTEGIYQGVVILANKIAEESGIKITGMPSMADMRKRQMSASSPAPQGRRTNLTLAKLTEGIEGAEHFDNKSQVFPYKYDDVWSAVDYVLKDKKEKIIQSDKETGVVITDTCAWFMNREYIKYYILIERINDVSSKLNLKLLAYDSVWNENLKRSFKEPMNKACVNTRTMKFLERINKRLKNNK